MTGARAELLSTRRLGPVGVQLLYRTVRQVVRMRNLPPPAGETRWDPDTFVAAAHETFAERDGEARLYELAAKSTDEDTFRSMLWTTVQRGLTDLGRRTERGRLTLRLQEELGRLPGCSSDTGVYRLGTAPSDQPQPRFDELVTLASAVPVNVPTWNDDAARKAPFADKTSYIALLTTLLERAPEGLRLGDIVDAIAIRLGVHDTPIPADRDVLDTYLPAASLDTAADIADMQAAEDLLAALTVDQQLVLPHLDETIANLCTITGLRRNKAWRVQAETRGRLAELLTDGPDGAAVLRQAIPMALARWELPP